MLLRPHEYQQPQKSYSKQTEWQMWKLEREKKYQSFIEATDGRLWLVSHNRLIVIYQQDDERYSWWMQHKEATVRVTSDESWECQLEAVRDAIDTLYSRYVL